MSERFHDIAVTVNGEEVRERVDARKTLVDFLREDVALTGSHVGCEHGVCGACSVRVDGVVVRGCLMLAVQCDGARVDTIEGVADTDEIADLQQAFVARNALQCGYCTPGMLLTAQELLARGGVPSREQIRTHLSGNYCRCTGYQAIVDAVGRWRRRGRERSGERAANAGAFPRAVAAGGFEHVAARSARMKIADDSPPIISALDRPNSYIGRSVPRPNLARLTRGRAQFVSDMTLPRMAQVAFVRSPHAHARIAAVATAAARKAPGVVAVVTGAELAKVITPWVGVLTHLKGIKSAPQHAIAVERACWQGEAVCAVVARTRAEAEDACGLV